MHHFSLLSFLLAFIALVHAWDYAQQLQQELQNEGLTALANIVLKVNQTSTGQSLLSQVSQGNFTFFAPTDKAILNISTEVSCNVTLLAEYLSYHFVHGDFQNVSFTNTSAGGTTQGGSSSTQSPVPTTSMSVTGGNPSENSSFPQLLSGVFPNTTLGRTLLNSSDLVMLPGNKSQVLAWTRIGQNGNVTILNQSQNTTVINATRWNNLFINVVDGVLIPPGNITTALNATNATITLNILSSIQVPSSNGTNETVLEFLQEAPGITFFVPNNDSFTSAVNQTIASLRSNNSALTALLQNHYINGTVLYSPEIQAIGANNTAPNATSAAGEPLHFITNSTGTFVEGPGGSVAQIVRPDVLVDNGVIHIINGVLLTNASNPSAASSAFASATSAAASSTTETAPIGVTTTSGASASVTSSSPTSSSAPSTTSASSSGTSSTGTASTSVGSTVTVTASA